MVIPRKLELVNMRLKAGSPRASGLGRCDLQAALPGACHLSRGREMGYAGVHAVIFFCNPDHVALNWSEVSDFSTQMREGTTATSFFLTDTQYLFPVFFSFHFSALDTHPCAPRTDLPHISFIFKIILVLFIFILFNSIVPPPHSSSLRTALSNSENIGRNLTSYFSFSPLKKNNLS